MSRAGDTGIPGEGRPTAGQELELALHDNARGDPSSTRWSPRPLAPSSRAARASLSARSFSRVKSASRRMTSAAGRVGSNWPS